MYTVYMLLADRCLHFACCMLWLIMSSIFDSVSWTPSFLLKRYVLNGIHGGPHEPFIADSVDFVVAQVKVPYRSLQTLFVSCGLFYYI